MKPKLFVWNAMVVFLFSMLLLPPYLSAQGPGFCPPDKELCASMLRFGKQAYLRGKYLDAKEYFRKAVQADPNSTAAWIFYDQCVLFGLAEKVEQNSNLILPGVSSKPEHPGAALPAAPEASKAEPTIIPPQTEKKGAIKFKIVDDEGC